ncbi:hypothetical protein ACOI1C_18470 [Bacillus sp. DJP31]|uniref:hypothetical protein n=1 Tax=Bacillus sp. DJP31 TaxID=3409789 RepID=UPI003BB5AD22
MKKMVFVFLATIIFIGSAFPQLASANSTSPTSPTSASPEYELHETPEQIELLVYADKPNEQGIFEEIRKKVITSNTINERIGDELRIIFHVKEDYYDLNDNFIESIVFYEEGTNDFKKGTLLVKNKSRKILKDKSKAINKSIEKKFASVKEDKKFKSKAVKDSIELELAGINFK